ncbi:MAG: DUF2235 domain-containing protein [Candidatus Methylumidiphilus sp.]
MPNQHKNIALFYDGTWEGGEIGKAKTNVKKLFDATELSSDFKRYIPGLGIDLLDVKSDKIFGGGCGRGISEKIQEGYKFLVKNYLDGDHIYLFGFSRGAYAARSLSGFIDQVGLFLKDAVEEEGSTVVKEAFDAYSERNKAKQKKLIEELKKKYPQHEKNLGFDLLDNAESNREFLLPIYFIGVWDTVGILGIPIAGLRILTEWAVRFHDTNLPRNVTHARHALALHERRKTFEPTLWTKTPHWNDPKWRSRKPSNTEENQTLKQVWFPGAHSDVGGGYSEEESWLSNAALLWMAQEAKEASYKTEAPLSIALNESDLGNKAFIKLHQKFTNPFSKPREALSKDYKPPNENWSNSESEGFWNTIHFHEYSLLWILDSMQGINTYSFSSFTNKKLKQVDNAACELIQWLVQRRISVADKKHDLLAFANLLKQAIKIKIHQLSACYRYISALPVTEKLDSIINTIFNRCSAIQHNKSLFEMDSKDMDAFHELDTLTALLENAKRDQSQALYNDLELIAGIENIKNQLKASNSDDTGGIYIDEEYIIVYGVKL